jgi:hypothetical protein
MRRRKAPRVRLLLLLLRLRAREVRGTQHGKAAT